MIKRVLVVGGAGYIGGSVTDVLIKTKIPFSVYDNLTYENEYLKPVDFIFGDIRDRKKLEALFPSYSHVIWLAAIVGDGACAIKPQLTKEINQDSVRFLSQKYKGKIIFTSTCSVYGINTEPVDESSKTNPLSIYAATKLNAEKYLYKNNSLIFRLGTVYGISDCFSRIRMDLAINYMTMNAIKYKKLTVFGGKQFRPFVHVKHIGEIIVKNLGFEKRGIYNIASENASIIDVAKQIKKETRCKVVVTGQKFEDDRNYFANVKRGLQDNIFTNKTKYSIEYGIKEIKELVLSKRIKDLELKYYSNERYLLESMLD